MSALYPDGCEERPGAHIILNDVDEVLLARAAFSLGARGHGFRRRDGDPHILAGQDLLAVEVASIGHDIEALRLERGFRLLRHPRELRAIVAHVDQVVDHGQVMFGVDRNLHVINDDP
jgi:hypothetical protein